MFWKDEAYQIAKKITSNSPLYRDLVSHVYLLLHDKSISSEDLPRVFAKYCYNQWTWGHSEWNKQLQSSKHIISLDYDIPLQGDDDNDRDGEYKQYLNEYMDKDVKDDKELFIREVTRMHIYGMTYREIRDQTGLSLSIIHSAIKQFKYDLFSNYSNGHFYLQNSPDF